MNKLKRVYVLNYHLFWSILWDISPFSTHTVLQHFLLVLPYFHFHMGVSVFFPPTNHPTLNAVNIYRVSQTVGASVSQQYRTTWVTMLQCLDFSWTWARILNLPLMNFQLDNWQNAAHERVWGHPRGARELEHATRARAATSSPIPIFSPVPNETSASIACPFAASDWLSIFLSLSVLFPLLHRVKC